MDGKLPTDPPQPGGAISQGKQPAAGSGRERKKMGKREAFEPIQLNMLPMMALFTIILCYLLESYSTDPMLIKPTPETILPKSTSDLSPMNAVQLVVSSRVILVGPKKVATVKNGRVLAEFKKDRNPASMYIPPLYDALKKAGDKLKMFARYNKKKQELQFKGLLTIIADKRVPFRLLTEVLYTAGQAEYGAYKFAVIKKKKEE